jgi:hypothetical protein
MLKEKLLIFLISTLLLHIPLSALTDGQNDRGTKTLAARGLEELRVNLPDCIVPIGDNGSSHEGHSSGGLIVIKINETQLSWKQQLCQ